MAKKEQELRVEYIPIGELQEYEGNAKLHPQEQIDQIAESIKQFGMNDPIAVWKDGVIIEGHGRLLACRQLGIDRVPIIRLDGLTDAQRRAYTLVHNKLTLNSGFEIASLSKELKAIDEFDMQDFGFGLFEMDGFEEEFEPAGYDKQIEDGYPEKGLKSFNCIISCLNEEEYQWLVNFLREKDGKLKRTYNCAVIMERYEDAD